MSVSILSVNVLTVLFINLTILLKECFSRINKCLCELIQCAGEESVGLYRQISSVKHPQQLIEVNYNSDRPKSRIQHVRRGCDFLCDFIDHLNSVYSGHTLLLVTFYVVIFIYDSYYSFIGIMDVNRGHFGSVMWVSVTSTETFFNGVGFTVLIYFCSSTTCEVRLLYIFSF
jgi:7tm Chemosensory receptor.